MKNNAYIYHYILIMLKILKCWEIIYSKNILMFLYNLILLMKTFQNIMKNILKYFHLNLYILKFC